jgi:hypothetical protein
VLLKKISLPGPVLPLQAPYLYLSNTYHTSWG